MSAPTAREKELLEVIEGMVNQFAYRRTGPALHTGGLYDLEAAFEVLGYDDPQFFPDAGCQAKGCKEWDSSGQPTPAGYKRYCTDHSAQFRETGVAP